MQLPTPVEEPKDGNGHEDKDLDAKPDLIGQGELKDAAQGARDKHANFYFFRQGVLEDDDEQNDNENPNSEIDAREEGFAKAIHAPDYIRFSIIVIAHIIVVGCSLLV